MGSTRRLVVPDAAAGQRVDAHVAACLPDLSRSRVAQLLADGRIRLDGRVPRKSERVEPGAVLEVEVPEPTPSTVEP